MTANRSRLLGITLGLALVVACWWFLARSQERLPNPAVVSDGTRPTAKTPAESIAKPSTPPPSTSASHSPLERIQATAQALQRSPDAASKKRALEELQSQLAALPKDQAVAALGAALKSQLDAPTGLDLKPSASGTLAQASSLRVFLLDQLAALDPAAAAVIAKSILQSFTTPDEWAISLRTYARAQPIPESDLFLRDKTRDMIRHVPWQHHPSAGFLEAFDVVVYNRDTQFTPDLAKLLRSQENRALAHAAYLTLDRLILSDASAVLDQLQAQPELLQGRDQTRANYFARADVREESQRRLLEQYLLDPRRSGEELAAFAGIFPNANFMISHNLLTSCPTPDGPALAERDRHALDTINQWVGDPRFASIKPHLDTLQRRLQYFVDQRAKP